MAHKALALYKRCVIGLLIFLMALTVFLATVDLAWLIIKDLMTPPTFLLHVEELLDIFGLFLLVLIGLELLDTITIYLTEEVIHAEIVLTVAMIAIARKIIILDVKDLTYSTILSIAAIIVALAGSYYVFKLARCKVG